MSRLENLVDVQVLEINVVRESVNKLGCRGCGAAGIFSEDEVEEESSSFVGENAGDCGLWDLGGEVGLYSGGGE